MQDYVNELLALRRVCGEQANALAAKHKLVASEPPIEALSVTFNLATVSLELASHYVVAWGAQQSSGVSKEEAIKQRPEKSERLMILAKTMFVWAMSAMEHTSKQSLATYPGIVPLTAKQIKRKDLFFREVITASADCGLIDPAQKPLWYGANTIRNRLVHNNGIGDGANKWDFTKELTVTMADGKMIQGTLMTFPRLTSWLVVQYAVWCDRFLQKAVKP